MHSGHLITLFSARNYFKRAGTGATGGFPRTHNLHTQYTHTHNTYIQHAHANTRKHTQTHTLKIHTHTNDASSSCSTSNHDQKPCAPTAKPLETAVPETAVCNTIGQLAESNDGALLLVAMDDAGNLRVRPKRLRHRLVEQPAGGGPPASASDDESGQQRSCCLFILPTRLSNARVLFLFLLTLLCVLFLFLTLLCVLFLFLTHLCALLHWCVLRGLIRVLCSPRFGAGHSVTV